MNTKIMPIKTIIAMTVARVIRVARNVLPFAAGGADGDGRGAGGSVATSGGSVSKSALFGGGEASLAEVGTALGAASEGVAGST